MRNRIFRLSQIGFILIFNFSRYQINFYKFSTNAIVQNQMLEKSQLNQRNKSESFEDRHIIAKHNTIYPTNEEVIFYLKATLLIIPLKETFDPNSHYDVTKIKSENNADFYK